MNRQLPQALAALLLTACATAPQEPIGEVTQPAALTEPAPEAEVIEDVHIFVHDAGLLPLAHRAAQRILKASGLVIHVNERMEGAYPVFASDGMCGYDGANGLLTPTYIIVSNDCTAPQEHVLTHELLHMLGVMWHLPAPQRGILAETDRFVPAITAEDLEALCSVRECTAFVPEQ
jgi:hypothetical protein